MTYLISFLSIDSLILAQAPAAQPAGGGGFQMMLMFLFMFGMLYFFMIAPQKRKQKEHETMVANLKSGETIITNGGIFGTITNVKEDRFVLKVADNTKIEVTKSCIAAKYESPNKS